MSKAEVIRWLKGYVAREVFSALQSSSDPEDRRVNRRAERVGASFSLAS